MRKSEMSHDLIDCTGTSYGKTVTKGNSARQALISVHAETSDPYSEPFGKLRTGSAKTVMVILSSAKDLEILRRPPSAGLLRMTLGWGT